MKKSKSQIKAERILQHGFNLQRIFNLSSGPVTLCKQVHRIETRAHTLAEKECNGETVPKNWNDKILQNIDNILHFKSQNIPVFINGDPRGYALKIDDDYTREHNLEIHKDWGGYGIIAPEFDGN